MCIQYDKLKEVDMAKYEQVKTNHACRVNFQGSAPSMEAEGARRVFQRSIEKHGVRYTEFFGDGDSKGFPTVEKNYDDVTVIKRECIGHVQKRVGTLLRKLKKLVKGLGGKGKLPNSMTDKLQNYYGIALRSNVGNLENMKKAFLQVCFMWLHQKAIPGIIIVHKGKIAGVHFKQIKQMGQQHTNRGKVFH